MEKINALLDESTSEWNMQEKNIMYKALRERFGEKWIKLSPKT